METLNPLLIDWGVASTVLAGQRESGDQYVVKVFPNDVLAGVVDGLGHGSEAAMAAELATRTLESYAHEPVISLLNRCHQVLRPTRGAVMSLASFTTFDETVTWSGVGNVQGVLHRADPAADPAPEYLLLRGGVVGDKFERAIASIVPIAPGDTLILTTDGIQNDFPSRFSPAEAPQHIASRVLSRYAKGTDDALVVVARYKGRLP